ncbi:biogenesis of lysosome-related organelles complex 1 subunit 6 isoform X3 [Tursiops truncatus]|uniref:biogenesis of lysosome-related organelles complex 1 subunit 6 isoform X3 n=2 Tax=Delphinidae TaxID=9726 RepID=UPI003CCF0B21
MVTQAMTLTHLWPGAPVSPSALLSQGLSDTSPDEGLIEDLTIEDKAVEQLAEGLLSHYLPDLQRSKQALQELTQNQVVLLDTLEQEISKFKECHSMLDINALFTEAKHYHAKLVNIRKEMLMLHEKTSKLKKRALKLQQKRQKEELEREQQREKEFEREKQLTAKPAKRMSSRKKITLTSTLTSTQKQATVRLHLGEMRLRSLPLRCCYCWSRRKKGRAAGRTDSPGRNKEAEESGHAGRALLCKPKDPPEDASLERTHQSPSYQSVLMRGAPTSLRSSGGWG